MATASVTFDRVYIMDPLDPLNPIVAGSTGGLGGGTKANVAALDGEFRTYVGRTRLITRTVTTRTFTFALRQLTYAQSQKLEGWLGRTLLFRDTYGRRVWGAYITTSQLEYVNSTNGPNPQGLSDVALTFQEITYSDEV
jgi:hypothetical protein